MNILLISLQIDFHKSYEPSHPDHKISISGESDAIERMIYILLEALMIVITRYCCNSIVVAIMTVK